MDGIIIINKPKNLTSHDIVYQIKKITGEKVGHTGTLDPLATGVLPILIGKGTLCSKYLINHDKTYQVILQLGIQTTTADAEGEILERERVKISWKEENIEKIMKTFLGKQEQTPPIYSAIKVKGKKLYEYARKGQKVEIPKRQIEIYDIKIQKIEPEKEQIHFQVNCSKGTYIRSLCEDIAKKLGTIGYMKGLHRTQVGEFSIDQAIDIDRLDLQNSSYITIEELFQTKPEIMLEQTRLQPFLNGVQITVKKPDNMYRIYCHQQFIGTGIVSQERLKRDIIL